MAKHETTFKATDVEGVHTVVITGPTDLTPVQVFDILNLYRRNPGSAVWRAAGASVDPPEFKLPEIHSVRKVNA